MSALCRVFHAFLRVIVRHQASRHSRPLGVVEAVRSRRDIASDHLPRKLSLHRAVHLHRPLTIQAIVNVALGLSDRLLRERPCVRNTCPWRRNESVNFASIKMSIQWPCQIQLLLLIRFCRTKSFFCLRSLIRLQANDLLPYQTGKAKNGAFDALSCKTNRRDRCNCLRAHALLVVQSENQTVSLLIRPNRTHLQTLIDLFEKQLPFDGLLAVKTGDGSLGLGIFEILSDFAAPALLGMQRFEVV